MQDGRDWFKYSVYSLAMAVLVVVGVPAGCAATSLDNSGWDYFDDDVYFLTVSVVLFVTFLLVSLATGIPALKERKIVALWVIPIGMAVIVAIGSAVYGLYIYIFDPFGMS